MYSVILIVIHTHVNIPCPIYLFKLTPVRARIEVHPVSAYYVFGNIAAQICFNKLQILITKVQSLFFLSFLRISKHQTGSKRPIHANHAVGRNNISFLKFNHQK